eukprot:g27886.t2
MVSTKAIHAFASSWRCRCPSATLVCRLLIASSTFAFSLGFAAHRMRLMTALARCLSDQVVFADDEVEDVQEACENISMR